MDFRLSEDQLEFREHLRRFCVEQLAPHAAERDATGRFEEGLVGQLAEMGLFGTYIPEEFGGFGQDVVTYIMTVDEVSRACGATGILISAHHSLAVDPILNYGSDEQKRKYLPKMASGEWIGCFSLTEPGSGSDAGAAKCRAEETDDGWVINGTKNFVTNGGEAHVAVVFAVTDPDDERRRMSAFIVERDTPGFAVGKLEKKLGIRASSTAELVFEDCRVPKEALLGERGKGLRVALGTLDGGRIGVAAQAVGISQAALDESLQYSQTRHQFDRPISAFQANQWKLADMQVALHGARLLMNRAAWLKEQGRPYATEAAMAKLYASEASNRITQMAIQLFGGYGYCQDYPVERLMRDARITELYEGTSEIQRLVIARQILKASEWVAR